MKYLFKSGLKILTISLGGQYWEVWREIDGVRQYAIMNIVRSRSGLYLFH